MALQVLRWQPFKGLYLTYQVISTFFVRIPLWVVFNLPRSWRPRKSWTLGRVIRFNLLRHINSVLGITGLTRKVPDYLSITPSADGHGVWIEPVPHLIGGELKALADTASVASISIPGYWLCKAGSLLQGTEPPQPGEKVILILHGGGYAALSAHPDDMVAGIPRGLLEHVSLVQRTFSPEYRLSRAKPFDPAHPFPAALLDALAGYNYLVKTIGFSPFDIYIEGDSAGANLALALTRYLVENKDDAKLNLPAPPGGLILLSPWGDIGSSHDMILDGSTGAFVATNYLPDPTKGGFDYIRDAFLGPHGLESAAHNRYISPASLDPRLQVDFKDFPRTFVVAGGAEIFLDQIRTLKVRMVKDLGEGDGRAGEGKVKYFEAPDAIHDYLVFPWHEPERSMTLKEINRWVSIA